MRTISILFLFLTFSFSARADVEIEYAVITNKQLPQVLHPLFPQRILIGINTQGDIVVRGENPSEYKNSYDLYPNGHSYWYQCQDNLAYQRPYSRATHIFYPDDPPVEIAGLSCRRAVSVVGKDSSDIYFTTSFGVDFCPTAEIRGFAMQFTRIINGTPVVYQAVRYNAGKLPAEWFDLSRRKIIRFKPGRPINIDAMEQNMAGRKAAAVSGTPLNKPRIKTKMLVGKVIVLSFWFTESMACLEQIPKMERIAERFAGREDVVFLAAMPESEFIVSRWMHRQKLRYSIIPEDYHLAYRYRVKAYPTTVVIDKDGYIAEYIAGTPWDLDDRLNAVLQWAVKQER